MKVSGTVKDRSTGKGVPNANIVLTIGEAEFAVLHSDKEGEFLQSDEGEYIGKDLTCEVKKAGYDTLEITKKIDREVIALQIQLSPEPGQVIPTETKKKWPVWPWIVGGIVLLAIIVLVAFGL